MLFSGEFGEFAFGEAADIALDPSAFEAFIAQVGEERCWLMELDAFSLASTSARSSALGDAGFGELGFGDAEASVTGGLVTLRYASHGYISRIFTGGVAGSDPDYPYFYDGRMVVDQLRFERRIQGRDGIGGLARVFAEVELVNTDGALDTLQQEYAIDGRRVQIWLGRPTWQRADFGLVFSGVVNTLRTDLTRARFSLSDGISKLEQAVNATTYAGTGNLEGGTDLVGKQKPRAFGVVLNVPAVLVESTKLIYQVNDGAIQDVTMVYDRGVQLTQSTDYTDTTDLLTNAPSAGQYRVLKTGGYFRLGATPAGTVTADVQGDATGSYVNTTGDIVQRLLDTADLTTSEIDTTSIAQLVSDQPAQVGIWIGAEKRFISSVIDELLAGVGAFGGFSRYGTFSVGLVREMSGRTPVAEFDELDIIAIEREPLPAAVEPICWRVGVGYQRNYTVQTDLASSVTAARLTFAAQTQRISSLEDASVKTRYLLAQEFGPVEGLFALQADAATEASRIYALWTVQRGYYRVRLDLGAITCDLGSVVTLTHTRFGLSTGLPGLVMAQRLDRGRIELGVLV